MKIAVDRHDVRLGDIIRRSSGLEHADIGIIGVPFDGSTRGRPGARFAPQCIRSQLYSFTTQAFGVSLSDITIGDFGDAPTYYGSVDKNKEEIRKFVSNVLKKCKRLVVLGGDHSITEPCFDAFSANYDSVGLIVFDAHLDMRELSPGAVSSGTVMGDIISKNPKLCPRNIIYVGIRDFANPTYYLRKAERLGATIFFSKDILFNGVGIEKILETITSMSERVDAVYVSLDVDSLDCSYAPGVNAPSPLGLKPEHICALLEKIGEREKFAILDVTEVAPPYDPTGITCRNAAVCVLSYMAGVAGSMISKPSTTRHRWVARRQYI